ncbi:transposase [Bdellovibrio sp. HCB2-146]|uniref:transposase n=1 Tax=Bdellovibrio sp. HCB2-146 TaxID=3394362 RepID=UPI0039BD4A15
MRGKTYIWAFVFANALTIQSQAQSSSKASLSKFESEKASSVLKLPPEQLPKKESRPVQTYGQIRLEGMQYLTPISEEPSLTYSQFLSARLSLLKEASWIDSALDVSGGTFFSRGQSHYIVHEAYVATKDRESRVYVGRKKMDWSEMDRRWQLGLYQSKFAIDALRPEEQGLVGAFYNYNKEKFEFLIFASPIFIPSMGPDIREESGGLVSDSRWYRAPSRNYDFNSRINTIQYELSIPDVMKLATNAGGAMMTRVGSKERGPWATASAGYMPVNELTLKRQAFKVINQDQFDVTVSPTVTYHHIRSLDVGYSFNKVQTSVSYLEDSPIANTPDQDWAVQKLEPIQAYSIATDFTLEQIWGRTLAIQLGYLKVEGGSIVDIRDDGAPDKVTLFDQRLKFTNAFSVRLEGQLATFWRRPFVTRFKYLYDQAQRGSLVNTEFLYYPNQKWAVVMGADILGVEDESYKPGSFLNEYRANDRFYGGMTYVF